MSELSNNFFKFHLRNKSILLESILLMPHTNLELRS